VAAGKLADIPVDYGVFNSAPHSQLLLDHLRPGDISTHLFIEPAPLLDQSGVVQEYIRLARKRGVKFDVGHGSGSFVWTQAEPLIRQGFHPDSISTDLHSKSMNGGMKDMNNVMSKILSLGVPFEEIIRMSTVNPADEIRRPSLGRLSVGSEADVAVLRRERGQFGFIDSCGQRRAATERITCELTLRAGRAVWDLNGRTAR
jgi:dihydroorotase